MNQGTLMAVKFQCSPRCTPMAATDVFAAKEWMSLQPRAGSGGSPNAGSTCFEVSRPLRTEAVRATNRTASTA